MYCCLPQLQCAGALSVGTGLDGFLNSRKRRFSEGYAVLAEPSAQLEAEYVAAVQPHAYGTFDYNLPGAYMYDLAKRAKANSGGGARQRQKKLMKELRSMQADGGLPVAAGASVFVRSDEERLDIVPIPPIPPPPHVLSQLPCVTDTLDRTQ
jgi:hypothetical protein